MPAWWGIANLARSYYGVHALRGVGISVQAGRITGLIGPNGAGKTTLFNCISGLVPPDPAASVQRAEHHALAAGPRHRRRPGAQLPDRARLSPPAVLENLLLYGTRQPGERIRPALLRTARGAPPRSRVARARRWHRRAAEPHARAAAPRRGLSGGQKKLLEIGRALMAEPTLLLLDEPVAGVNPTLAREIGEHLRSLRAEGISVLLIEHHLDTIAALCDPVIVMAEGRHLREGTFDEVANDRRCRRPIWAAADECRRRGLPLPSSEGAAGRGANTH